MPSAQVPELPRNDIQVIDGRLKIDFDEGTITFVDGGKVMLLRITHLKKPFPRGGVIDIVALAALTSYTQGGQRVEPT